MVVKKVIIEAEERAWDNPCLPQEPGWEIDMPVRYEINLETGTCVGVARHPVCLADPAVWEKHCAEIARRVRESFKILE